MIEFGERLKKAREAQGIPLEAISERTKINIKFLRAMEAGDFTFLPEAYVRAFIKTYAREVGLDGDALLQDYEALKQPVPTEEIPTDNTCPVEEETLRTYRDFALSEYASRAFQKIKALKYKSEIALTISVFIILISIVYIYRAHRSEISEDSMERWAGNDYKTTETITEANEIFQAKEEKLLELEFVVFETTWVQIAIDDSARKEYMLNPGDIQKWLARDKYVLRIGNGAGVSLILNGKPLGRPGAVSEVVDLILTKEGIVEKYTP